MTPSPAIDPLLPQYQGITLADVVLVVSEQMAAEARAILLAEDAIGFDTESKPTFAKGELSSGPHLIQLATATRVYLFPVARQTDFAGLKAILESTQILKVGFGLASDLAHLRSRLGIDGQNVLDLSRVLRGGPGNHHLGAKSAVAHYFGQRLQKSKRTTTSNWANPQLTERQMLYAANDAHVALRVFHAALLSDPDLRATSPPAPLNAEPEQRRRALGDSETRRLIGEHTPLVKQIARGLIKTLPPSVQTDDLIQDGLLGLMDAVIRSSQEATASQLAKYIAQRARGAMLDGLRINDFGTRRVRREMRRVELALQQLGHRLGRSPSEGEVAAELDMSLAAYQKLLQEAHGYSLVSLDDLGGIDAADDYLEQCLSSEQDPLVVLQRAAFRQGLAAALAALPGRERAVVAFYYDEGRNMREIGDLLDISEARISQIHAQAIARLRVAVLGGEEDASLLTPRRAAR